MAGLDRARGRHASYDPAPDEPLLSIAEVAALAQVPRATIQRLVDSGELPSIRVGRAWRIPASVALALLRNG